MMRRWSRIQAPTLCEDAAFAAEGERLWVHRVTCGGCKQVMGWAFVGDLPGMKDDQLRDLQKRLEIGDDAPLLATVDDWRIFYKDRPLPDPAEPR